MKNIILILFGVSWFYACVTDTIEQSRLDLDLYKTLKTSSPTGLLDFYQIPTSENLNEIPQDPRNPLTKEKVILGSFLFYETGMGVVPKNSVGQATYSCASCHVPSADFKPGRIQGIGEGGSGFGFKGESRVKHSAYEENEMDVQGIRPLSVLNVAFSAENTLWNGSFGSTGANSKIKDVWGVLEEATVLNHLGYQGLETQNIEGLRLHRMLMTEELAAEMKYTPYFDAAFPEIPKEERYSNLTTSLAISAYLRSLTTSEAPFQKWLSGEHSAMTDDEKRGAILFFGDANCNSCHSNPALSAVKFFALGVNDLSQRSSFNENPESAKKNLGRGGFTGRTEDMFKFKVPTLYNLQRSPFYFHGGSMLSLEEVVDYFDKAMPENPKVPTDQIAADFKPLNLTAQEKANLVSFLRFSLQDGTVEKFQPSSLPSGNCFPNADSISKREIGCTYQ